MKKVFISFLFALFCTSSAVEVQQLGLGFGGSLMCFHIDSDETVWCGVDVAGLYKSTDHCKTWSRVNNQVVNDHISAIWVHPQNTNFILLGCKGGILKSDDGGETWQDVRNGLPEHNYFGAHDYSAPINCFAHDPQNADVIYAGVGDRRDASKYHYNNLGEDGYGKGTIYKSIDGGKSWKNLRDFSTDIYPSANIFSILVSGQNSDKIFAATSRGFYRSVNGGSSWELLTHGLPHTLVTSGAIHPLNDQVLYVTIKTADTGYGVYKSINGGDSWTAVNNGIPRQNMNSDLRPFHLIVDWKNPDTVYMGATESGGVWKTTNGGELWENVVKDHVKSHGWQSYGNDYFKTYGFAQSPINNDFLVAGEHWAHMTDDGGETWEQIYSTNSSPYKNRGADFTVCDYVKVSPYDSDLLFMCVYDQGLYRSTNGGKTWENLHSQMRAENTSPWLVAVTDVEFGENKNIVYCAVELSVYGADAGYVIKKSTNAGRTWKVVLNGKKGEDFHGWGIYHGLEVDPQNPRTIYVTPLNPSGYATIRSQDGGQTWEKIGTNLQGNNVVRQLKVDPQNSSIIYIVSPHHNGNEGVLHKSTDGGETFEIVNMDPLIDPRDVAIDPTNSDILYLAETDLDETGGLYKSVDGGETWEPILTADINFPSSLQSQLGENGQKFGCNAVSVHPTNPDVIYASTGTPTGGSRGDFRTGYGLLHSTDGGITWYPYASDIKFNRPSHIDIDPKNPHIIYVGSMGAGGFKVVGDETSVEKKAHNFMSPSSIKLLPNYPNPFNPTTTISYELEKDSLVTMDLFDVRGSHIKTLEKKYQNAGQYQIRIDSKNLSSGIYFCKLTANNKTVTQKLCVQK